MGRICMEIMVTPRNLCMFRYRGTFLLVLIETVNIDQIFQNPKYGSCRVFSIGNAYYSSGYKRGKVAGECIYY